MIYLENTSSEQSIYVPLPKKVQSDVVTFTLYEQPSYREAFSVVVPTSIIGDYIVVTLSLGENFPSGEYQYRVSQQAEGVDVIVTGGIAKVNSGGVSYQSVSGNIIYQEYE